MTSNFQGNEDFLKVEKLLERKSKEIDIIKKVSNQINKTLNLNTISKSMQKLTPVKKVLESRFRTLWMRFFGHHNNTLTRFISYFYEK